MKKIQNGGVRHLELLFGLLVALKWHIKFGVDRACTFQNIVILKLCKSGLKILSMAPKIVFSGVLIPKRYFSLLRPQKALPRPVIRFLSHHWSH